MTRLIPTLSVAMLTIAPVCSWAQSPPSPPRFAAVAPAAGIEARLAAVEARLRAALDELATLNAELSALRAERGLALASASTGAVAPQAEIRELPPRTFAHQVLGVRPKHPGPPPNLAAKPDVFLQARYATAPLEDATLADYSPNFRVSRAAMRWAGSIDQRWGAAIELQYRAAPDARPEQLLNDAYLDFRVTPRFTIRAGQFVKPFGFDVQQLDADRESPERAMFAGYVFPGERDRGVMITGELCDCSWGHGLTFAAAVVNGNRFFSDSNRQVNYLGRIRKTGQFLGSVDFGVGASAQFGTQIVPPGLTQSDDEHAFGVDAQVAIGRLGVRGEFAHANRPSTLLAPQPAFAPAFPSDGEARTVSGSLTALWSLDTRRQVYVRVDALAGDNVGSNCPDDDRGGCDIRAVNGGFRQRVGSNGDIAVDVQWKDRLSFNHDAVNTRVQITSSVRF